MDTYKGTITEEGLAYSKYNYENIVVKVYGLTHVCLRLGEEAFQGKSDFVIVSSCLLFLTNQLNESLVKEYKGSYISEVYKGYDFKQFNNASESEVLNFYEKIWGRLEKSGYPLDDTINLLRRVYKVRLNNKWYTSTINQEMDRLQLIIHFL